MAQLTHWYGQELIWAKWWYANSQRSKHCGVGFIGIVKPHLRYLSFLNIHSEVVEILSHGISDTWNCGLRLRRECRERFPYHRLQRKPLVTDPGTHHGTCVTHVPWWMSGSLTRGGRANAPGILGSCATRNLTYLVRGQWNTGTRVCYIVNSMSNQSISSYGFDLFTYFYGNIPVAAPGWLCFFLLSTGTQLRVRVQIVATLMTW